MSTIRKYSNSLSIRRGPGFGVSYNFETNYDKPLPDDGAEVRFSNYGPETINIHFGYHSPGGKAFERDLDINMFQAVELRDYLNKAIERRSLGNDSIYILSYGLERDTGLRDSNIDIEPVGITSIKGYRLAFRKCSDSVIRANITHTGGEEDEVYFVIQKIKASDKIYYDQLQGLPYEYTLDGLKIELDGNWKNAYLYRVDEYISEATPTNSAIHRIINFAKENDFPPEYLEHLKSLLPVEK